MRERRALMAAIAVAVMTLLVGCGGIPTSGPVELGRDLTEVDSGEVEFFPLGPSPDATQEEILRGFVAAFSGSAGDYAVARQFLASDFTDQWDPRVNVTLLSGAATFAVVGDRAMTYSVSAAATVDATGTYRENSEPVPVTLPFEFIEDDGQWRILSAPDGIVLPEAQFQSIYDSYALYFLDPTADHLVPDLRWFQSGSAAPLRIVSALLDGPPEWLRGAVRTAFPDGTQLAAPSVDVESGLAVVDLSPEALGASAGERQLMRLQLTASLADIANIRRVGLSVSGTPLQIADPPESLPSAISRVDTRPAVLIGDQFGYLGDDAVTPIGGLSAAVAGTVPSAATVDAASGLVAVLGPAGVSLVADGAAPVVVDNRGGLVAPSLDDFGYAWSAQGGDPTTVKVTSLDGSTANVATGLPTNSTLVSVDVSRDGARVAFVVATATGSEVVVRAVLRDANAAFIPVSLGEPILDIAGRTGAPIDLTWVDDLSVALLSQAAEQAQITAYTVGGDSISLGAPPRATAVIGGNSAANLRGLSDAGTILARSGNGWTDTGVAVTLIATQR